MKIRVEQKRERDFGVCYLIFAVGNTTRETKRGGLSINLCLRPQAWAVYRGEKKSWYVVARNFFLLLLNFSAWPCLGPA